MQDPKCNHVGMNTEKHVLCTLFGAKWPYDTQGLRKVLPSWELFTISYNLPAEKRMRFIINNL